MSYPAVVLIFAHPRTEISPLSGSVGGVDVTVADVAVDNSAVGVLGLNIVGLASISATRTTLDTRLARIGVGGVARVEPEGVRSMVVPDGHNKDLTASEGFTHDRETTLGLEVIVVAKESLLSVTEVVRDGVKLGEGVVVGERVLDDLAILDVLAADLNELTVGGVVRSNCIVHQLAELKAVSVGRETH